jgi:transposase-like protein
MLKQQFLPGFPDGAVKIGEILSILKKDGRVTYFLGSDNYFNHMLDDRQSERFVLASLMHNGHVRACDLEAEPLAIPHRTLMNWVAQYRSDGPSSFFRTSNGRKTQIMTEEKKAECASLIAGGARLSEVARQTGIADSTLRKALKRKTITLLPESKQAVSQNLVISTKSERSCIDAQAASAMGTACTRADERMAAAVGLAQSGATRFEAACDVPMAGLLTGLPVLCANGLFTGIGKYLKLPKGFYSCLHILLILGFMALARIRRPEGLRHIPPGELGKVVGLDRAPEPRTLRAKISLMARTGNPAAWMKALSQDWLEAEPEEAGYLYVDGHVRVYNGEKATLPRRFVSREKLCLRGTTDYWVNDALGRPFFVVSKAVTDGLADSLLKDIVPELLTSVPGQPTLAELEADPAVHRFVMVFDREGANYSLLSELWKHRVGALTYRKNVKDVWPDSEFTEHEVPIPGGGSTRMRLATRDTRISSGKASMPVTEVRCLKASGHQTAIITSAKRLGNVTIAGRMFSRWCQENFFAYMMQHFDIDGLIEYGAEPLPGTLLIVNPEWRELDKNVRMARRSEQKHQAKLTQQPIDGDKEIQKKAEMVEALQAVQVELAQLRAQRKETPKKVRIDSLPEAKRPTQLLPLNKMLSDSVKMIAYRAETALVAILRRHLNKEEEARALIRELFVSSGDILPDDVAKTLTIKIHHMASPAHDKAIAALLEELNDQAFIHPETGQRLIYMLA